MDWLKIKGKQWQKLPRRLHSNNLKKKDGSQVIVSDHTLVYIKWSIVKILVQRRTSRRQAMDTLSPERKETADPREKESTAALKPVKQIKQSRNNEPDSMQAHATLSHSSLAQSNPDKFPLMPCSYQPDIWLQSGAAPGVKSIYLLDRLQ